MLLIGIGNEFRQDDGVGLFIIRELKKLHLPGITLREYREPALDLLDGWEGYKSVILFDAVSSGARPGTIYRLEPLREPIPQSLCCSTHTFSLAEVIEVGRSLDQLPEHLEVYGIEGKTFGQGQGLSEEVQMAGVQVVADIVKRLEEPSVS